MSRKPSTLKERKIMFLIVVTIQNIENVNFINTNYTCKISLVLCR